MKKSRTLVRRLAELVLLAGLVMTPGAAAAQDVSLSGTVRDNSANAIAGAEVQAFDTATQQLVASTLTDPTGLYSLLIAPGTYDVEVNPPAGSNFQTATALGQVITSNTVLNFVLVPSGVATLSGRLLDAQGNAVPSATVSLSPLGTGNSIYKYTDATGQYSFQVAPGDYNLGLYAYNWGVTPPNTPMVFSLSAPDPLNLTENRVLDLTLPLKRVSVHVQDPMGGAAVPGVALSTSDAWNPALEIGGVTFSASSSYPYYYSPVVHTDANGDATLWLLPNGPSTRYVITAAPPPDTPYAIFSVYDVTVEQDMSIVMVLELEGPPQPNACPLSQGFWKNHREIWPISSLMLGSQTYTLAELITLLQVPPTRDASLILVHQLIAAKTNIHWGSDPTPIGSTITDMDSLLASYTGRLPYNVKPSSKNGQKMTAATKTLDQYNNAVLTPQCDPTAPTLALTVTERDIAALTDRAMVAATIASLGHRERAALKVELDGARFNRFNRDLSRKALRAFVEDVRKLTREEKLAWRDGQELIDRANVILVQMK